ncbi:MAG: metallophosphoesterase [Planctomycetes bacterium]|nr:metallophosphoesterase [Planctomycetota bacterium]
MASADSPPPALGLRHPVVTFIGDVHGWDERLVRVLAQAEGFLVFLGDLIDRGPQAPAVIDRVRELCRAGRAACVFGNHEYALVRGLGVPELGIPADQDMFLAWAQRYGGRAVLAAYGVEGDDAAALRERLGDRLAWLATLPWMLSGSAGDRHWLAVHAGLGSGLIADQLPALEQGLERMRVHGDDLPAELYAKNRAFQVPVDCPGELCIVSGHTPIPEAHVSPRRILCDTSGGMRGRKLSAVIWPAGRVITS